MPSRRALLRGGLAFAGLSLLAGVRDRLLGNPFYNFGFDAADAVATGAGNAFAADPESELRAEKFAQLRQHINDAGGVDHAFPLPQPARLEILDWLFQRQSITGLANPMMPFTPASRADSGTSFLQRVINDPMKAVVEGETKRVLASAMNSKFGDNLIGNLYVDAPRFIYLELLAQGISKSQEKHKLKNPLEQVALTTPEGVLPLVLSGITNAKNTYRGQELRALAPIIEDIHLQRTGEDNLRLTFGKPVPMYGNTFDYRSDMITAQYSKGFFDGPKPPTLDRPTPIMSALTQTGGHSFLDAVFAQMTEDQFKAAWNLLSVKADAAQNSLIYEGMFTRPTSSELSWVYHPAKFYITEGQDMIRAAVKTHFVRVSHYPLAIISEI